MFIDLKCPKCSAKAGVEMREGMTFKFVMYLCPFCQNNIVYYAGKITAISESFRKYLCKKYHITSKQVWLQPDHHHSISDKDIKALKKLLETESSFDKILSKL